MNNQGGPGGRGAVVVPYGRATPAELKEQVEFCHGDRTVHAVLEAVDSYAVVLNAQRQILAASPVMLEALSEDGPASCQGLRFGEAIGCVHAHEGPDGCGSSRACQRCGALLSVLASQANGQPSEGECLSSFRHGDRWEAREFAVRASALTTTGRPLTLLTLRDISAQKRREALERIFIHDLMNTLQGLKGWAEILQGAGADTRTVADHVVDVAGHLTAEVEAHQRLLQAERGELVPNFQSVPCSVVLDELELVLGAEQVARVVRMPGGLEVGTVKTDPTILSRILQNMVTNALEALPTGGQARVWCERKEGHRRFVVENPGCMAPEVADRVFQRSFSTKGARGRGLGTYGMKLLGETVLGGTVGFTTNWTEGTRFFIELPGDD